MPMVVARALTEGGDARITLDGAGANAYGCPPRPDPALVALGSSTASVISGPAFEAAQALCTRLAAHPGAHAEEVARLRRTLLPLSGADTVPGTEVVLAASGTDLHLFATQLAASAPGVPVQAVMAEVSETGSGVPAALATRHFATGTCQGHAVPRGAPITAQSPCEPIAVVLRHPDGRPRSADDVDADFTAGVEQVLGAGRRCLLVLTDLTKTGLLAPTPACAARLRKRHGERLEVLVDACQFRLAPASLADYLAQDWMVAITGSKFVTGPAFCGALLLPPALARRCWRRSLETLRLYTARSHWPAHWPAADALDDRHNPGLLLRWQAALVELQRFRAVPEPLADRFFQHWGRAVAERLRGDTTFEALPVAPLDGVRGGRWAGGRWDRHQTVFPFVVHRRLSGGRRVPLTPAQTVALHRALAEADPASAGAGRFQLGQPVACGARDGQPVSALRLCASARTVVDATRSLQGRAEAVAQAMAALDKVGWWVRRMG
ncbi:hypothetical protein [Sphaerotilus sp.]|uniref:hypothetical protein n=1 Tax=Sphaerotilus sp. TaxID=2093942 RepID=UPI0025D9E873|nr:hypothetical protein [Sphaerotilus sp.]